MYLAQLQGGTCERELHRLYDAFVAVGYDHLHAMKALCLQFVEVPFPEQPVPPSAIFAPSISLLPHLECLQQQTAPLTRILCRPSP